MAEFPAVGSQFVFGNGAPYDEDGLGDGWNCVNYKSASDPSTGTVDYPGKLDAFGMLGDARGDAAAVSCFFTEPADLNDEWETERARRLPKLGLDGDTETTLWYRDSDSPAPGQPDGRIVRMTFRSAGEDDYDEYGDEILAVEIEAMGIPIVPQGGAGLGFARVAGRARRHTDPGAVELDLATPVRRAQLGRRPGPGSASRGRPRRRPSP